MAAIQEPNDEHGLWSQVKPRTLWPDTDENRVEALSLAWLTGAGVVGQASQVGQQLPAAKAGWRDDAGRALAERLLGNVTFATQTVMPEMYRLGAISSSFAADVKSYKEYVHQVIDDHLTWYRIAKAVPQVTGGAIMEQMVVNRAASAIIVKLQHILDETRFGGSTTLGVGSPPFLEELRIGDGRESRDNHGYLNNDWAGRDLLWHWLRGDGTELRITEDPEWTAYMMANQRLREQLLGPTLTEAQTAMIAYRNGEGGVHDFSRNFHATIENGEQMVGYQYLHGTNKEAGDFQLNGHTTVKERPDGTYEVTVDSTNTWNDRIDPNHSYKTDTAKARLAEIISDPKDYDVHIQWRTQSTIVLDGSGRVINVTGYPYE